MHCPNFYTFGQNQSITLIGMGIIMIAKVLKLSLSSEYIKIFECSQSPKGGIVMHNATILKMPEGAYEDGVIKDTEAIAELIREFISTNNIIAKQVIFTIESTKIAAKEVNLPKLNDANLKKMINANITEYFPVNIEEYDITYYPIEHINIDGKKMIRVNIIAAPDYIVETYYSLAFSLRLKVKSIDYMGNSLVNLIKKQISKEHLLVMHIGADETIVNIFKENVVVFQRNIPYGRVYLIENETTEEKIEALSYLSSSINRAIDYYITKSRDHHIEHVYLTGDINGIDEIFEFFAGELNINVEKLPITTGIMVSPKNTTQVSIDDYIELLYAGKTKVNLIAKSIEARYKEEEQTKNIRLIMFAAIGISVVLILLSGFQYFVSYNEKAALEEDINKISSIEAIMNDYYLNKDVLSDINTFKLKTITNNDSLLDFILELEKKLPVDVAFKSLTSNNGAVTFTGTSTSKETLAKLMDQLSKIENVSDVNIGSFSEMINTNQEKLVSFSITCNFSYKESVSN